LLHRSSGRERKKKREKERKELGTRKRMKKYDFSYGNHLSNLRRVARIWQKIGEKEMGKPQTLVLLIIYLTKSIEIVILHNIHSYICIYFFRHDRFNVSQKKVHSISPYYPSLFITLPSIFYTIN
jgi:hypothetical protein